MAEANIAENQANKSPPLTLENVMTVVKGVRNWRATAKELIYAYDEEGGELPLNTNLDALQRQYRSDENCLQEVVKIFLLKRGRYGPPSWRHVIWSLDMSDEIHLARQFQSYREPLADSTLTVENLIRVMDKVTLDEGRRRQVWKWVLELGLPGCIPSSYFDEVYSSDKEKAPILADVYVNSRPRASWQDLAETLYDRGELTAAEEAKSFLHNDPTFVVENVTAVLEKVSVDNRDHVFYLLGDEVYSELSSYTGDKDLLPACSEAYVSHPRSSWEDLTTLLYAEDELTAVDEARQFLPPRDLTITTDRLMKLFPPVVFCDDTFYEGFGGWLKLPQSATSEIQRSFQDDTKRTEAYLEAYAHQHPCPSWRVVASALRNLNLDQQAADTENTYVQGI